MRHDPRATSARPGATSGPSAGSAAHDHERREQWRNRIPSSARLSRRTVKCSCPRVQAPARRPCSSSASRAPSATTGSTSTRSSSSRTRARLPASFAPASARRCSRAGAGRGPRARRRLDLDDPRILQPAPARASIRRRARPAVPRARRGTGAGASSEAFDEALASFCAGDEPERLRLLVAYGGARLRRMLIGIYETLRAAGRPLVLELGEAAPLDDRLDDLREAARCLATDAAATTLARDDSAALLALIDSGRCRTGCSTSPRSAPGASAPRATRKRGSGSSRRRWTRSRPATGALAGAPESLPRGVLRCQGARVGARLRGSPARGARPPPRHTPRSASASSCAFAH